jgi:hypothetical protein
VDPIVDVDRRVRLSRLAQDFVSLCAGLQLCSLLAHIFRERRETMLEGDGFARNDAA